MSHQSQGHIKRDKQDDMLVKLKLQEPILHRDTITYCSVALIGNGVMFHWVFIFWLCMLYHYFKQYKQL